MQRQELAAALSIIKPAINIRSTTQLFSSAIFSDYGVSGYNDIISITAPLAKGWNIAIEATEILTLASTATEDVIACDVSDAVVTLKCGQTTLRTPVLQNVDQSAVPAPGSLVVDPLTYTKALNTRLLACLTIATPGGIAVHERGVIFEPRKSVLDMYATNRISVIHASTPFKNKFTRPLTFVLPTEFCKQATKLYSLLSPKPNTTKLHIGKKWVELKFESGHILGGRVWWLEGTENFSAEFKGLIRKAGVEDYIEPIPDNLVGCLTRAKEADMRMTRDTARSVVSSTGDTLTITTRGRGETKDKLAATKQPEDLKTYINPYDLLNALDSKLQMEEICFSERFTFVRGPLCDLVISNPR